MDEQASIGVDGTGNIYVSGRTWSRHLPIKDAFQAACPSGPDDLFDTLCESNEAFVMRLNADGKLAWSTYLGASDPKSHEKVGGMAVAPNGTVYVMGISNGASFPTRHAVQPSFGGGQCPDALCYDVFVSVFTNEGRLWSSTFLGGAGDDLGNGIVRDSAGKLLVTGSTTSSNYPTTANAAQGSRSGAMDMFMARLEVADAPLPLPEDPTTAVPTTAVPTTAVPTTPRSTNLYLPLVMRGGPPVPPPPPARGALYIDKTVKAASAASAVDASGGMHAAYRHFIPDAERPPAVYAYCPPPADQCGDPARWKTVKLADLVQEVQLALTPAGQPRLLIVATSTVHNGGKDYWYAACDAACSDSSRWSLTRVLSSYGTAIFDVNDENVPQRSFALDRLGRPRFVYMDRNYLVEPDHLSAFYAYCDSACANASSWRQTQIGREHRPQFRYEVWSYPSLTFTSANQPRVVAEVDALNLDGTPGQRGLYYVACDAGCDQTAGWQRTFVMDVGTGSWPPRSWDIELDSNNRPRIAIFTGDWIGDNPDDHRLFYAWCNAACLTTGGWQRMSVGLPSQDGQGPDLELDGQGRPRIAYATGSGNIGHSWCNTACESQAQWQHQVAETTAQMEQGNPQAIPPHCDQDLWKGLNPVLALDGAGNPRIAYDVSVSARCFYDDTPGNPTDPPRIEFGRIWNGVRWSFFTQP